MFLPTLGCVILTAVVGFFKIFLSLIQSGLLYCPINEWKQKQKREKEKGKNWKGRSAGEKGSKKEKKERKGKEAGTEEEKTGCSWKHYFTIAFKSYSAVGLSLSVLETHQAPKAYHIIFLS